MTFSLFLVIVNTEPTGTVISVGAHGGSPNPGTNQPESINLTSDQQPVSECSDTNQPASISADANLSSSDMDIVSIYSSCSSASVISDSVQATVGQGHTSVDSGSTGDTVSDSGE